MYNLESKAAGTSRKGRKIEFHSHNIQTIGRWENNACSKCIFSSTLWRKASLLDLLGSTPPKRSCS